MVLDIPAILGGYRGSVVKEVLGLGVIVDRVLVAPGFVESTSQEAAAVRRLFFERDFSSFIIVTNPYHTRRARMVFYDASHGTDTEIIGSPVPGPGFDTGSR